MVHLHLRHHHVAYPVTMHERLYTIVLGPLFVVALIYSVFALHPQFAPAPQSISLNTIIVAALYTSLRLLIAYAFAVLVAVPLAILTTSSAPAEKILLPVFDILESVPILALFPVIILLFIQFNFLSGAAVFILFLAMLWNIVFTLVGGLKLIPKDITYAAHVFGLSGWSLTRRITLPAIVPQLVTGSILAIAQGWNLIIVAEVLHTYIPGGTSAQDLFGIGSILVNAAAGAQQGVFLTAVVVMIVIIGLLNFFVWQRLLHYSQRFRFD